MASSPPPPATDLPPTLPASFSASSSPSFLHYLRNLGSKAPKTMAALYSSPSPSTLSPQPPGSFFALTVLTNLLNEIERCVVLRMVALEWTEDSGITERDFNSWFIGSKKDWDWEKLNDLCIISLNPSRSSSWFVKLRSPFHSSLRSALTSTQKHPWSLLPSAQLKPSPTPPPTLNELNAYTQNIWNGILHYLVGTKNTQEPNPTVLRFLRETGLMDVDAKTAGTKREKWEITKKGYDFMLKDVSEQVWSFVFSYLQTLQSTSSIISTLLLLTSLSHCTLSEGYPVSLLTKSHKTLMPKFKDFGLIYYTSGSPKFYPTSIAISLIPGSLSSSCGHLPSPTSVHSLLSLPDQTKNPTLNIIVQTNFTVVAYTSSPLHLSMLLLFCDKDDYMVLPNVLVMKLTRDSVKESFKRGIKCSQILKFLKKHSHPLIVDADYRIPENVQSQLHLWEKEEVRIKCSLAFKIYFEEEEKEVERDVAGWAEERGGLIFRGKGGVVVVKYEIAEGAVRFKKRRVREWREEEGGEDDMIVY
ncbi:hypothetical protein TrST_g6880 [Triparma strigata]|uniref:General transcription factor IIH subunit 4 n=1 Tax=Triparma strigata TaxID=1606541 RepID=A0A9W7BG48_9STRA|nr:hypothetical protein TrST_g6880 [Triparma strigata]